MMRGLAIVWIFTVSACGLFPKGSDGSDGATGATGAAGKDGSNGAAGANLSVSSVYKYDVSGATSAQTDLSGANALDVRLTKVISTTYSDGSVTIWVSVIVSGQYPASCSISFASTTSEQSGSCRLADPVVLTIKATSPVTSVKLSATNYSGGSAVSDTTYTLTKQ